LKGRQWTKKLNNTLLPISQLREENCVEQENLKLEMILSFAKANFDFVSLALDTELDFYMSSAGAVKRS